MIHPNILKKVKQYFIKLIHMPIYFNTELSNIDLPPYVSKLCGSFNITDS